MALPSSGTITINDIRTELANTSGSLRTLSAAAGKSTPDAMSEFYGYSSVNPTDYFDVITYTGDGTTSNQITGLSFFPALVIIKNLSATTTAVLYEDSRGAYVWQPVIPWRFDTCDQWWADEIQLNSNGFTAKQVSTNRWINYNGDDYIAFCWAGGGGETTSTIRWWVDGTSYSTRPSSLDTPTGFTGVYSFIEASVNSTGGYGGYWVTYTAARNATLEYISHGLGSEIGMLWSKVQAGDSGHEVYHKSLPNANYSHLTLDAFPANDFAATPKLSSFQTWDNDSSKFAFGYYTDASNREPHNVNAWAEKTGISKFDSYTGGSYGSSNIINCGFQPRLVWIKCYTSTGNWIVYSSDIAGTTSNFSTKFDLFGNTALPAAATNYNITFTGSGFYFNNSGSTSIAAINKTGDSYIFCAWA